MPACVLLLHELPDGSSHYDWLLSRAGGGSLVTFRLFERLDLYPVPAFRAERLADHREAYLTYEGPIAGGRGRVRRLASGTCRIIEESAERFEAAVRIGSATGVVRGVRGRNSLWMMEFEEILPSVVEGADPADSNLL